MRKFKVGDIIEALDTCGGELVVGRHYEVRWVGQHKSANNTGMYEGIHLIGVTRKQSPAFPFSIKAGRADRFRLVRHKDMGMPDARDYLASVNGDLP